MDSKIIVSNRSALIAKYGQAGLSRIKAGVAALIKADAKRHLKTRLVFMDDPAAMKRFRGRAVTDRRDARQNKEAVDAIFKAVNPEYLMILGSIDVVPHQDLANPLFDPSDDPDQSADGDLPYACDAPYSRDIANFRGPTRVIGRLPDLTGAREPSHLLALLDTAVRHRSRNVADYGSYFALSTKSWRKSTELSLFNVFGNASALKVSPPRGPSHHASHLAPIAHFINCHGGLADPTFYGEDATRQPRALTSDSIARKIRPGTVAAVECCYGAELYDSVTLSLSLPICQHYLLQGACGYFGSSTIAYGPDEGNGAADLIAQYFLLAILLEGASLGRAALIARQRYVEQVAELDPVDLKTLGQFNLLGDPSIHPAVVPSATGIPRGVNRAEVEHRQRIARRASLRKTGKALQENKPTASRKSRSARKSATVQKALANIARQAGIGTAKAFTAFDVKSPPALRRRDTKTTFIASRYYVAVYLRDAKEPDSVGRRVAAVAKEVGGRIVGYRIYEGR